MRSAIKHLYASHAIRAPIGANKIQCLQGKLALVEASKPLRHDEPAWSDNPFRPSSPSPCQGAMVGNVLVVGVGAVLEGMCPRQHMRPSVGLVPTLGLTVGARGTPDHHTG